VRYGSFVGWPARAKRLLGRLGAWHVGNRCVGWRDHGAQRLTQLTDSHVVVQTRQHREAIGNWRYVFGCTNSLHPRIVPPLSKQLDSRENMIGLSAIRIAPEAFQHEHEPMDTLAK